MKRSLGLTWLGKAAGLTVALGALAVATRAGAADVWGYGVKSCSDFLAAAPGEGAPAEIGSPEYLRYREWLAGLITGLNLATATDVLRGAEVPAALARIRAHCQAHPADDFFTATMALVRSLSKGGEGGKAGPGRAK